MKVNIRNSDDIAVHDAGCILIQSLIRKRWKIDKIIDRELGPRPKQAKYTYSDLIEAAILSTLANNKRHSHIYELKSNLDRIDEIELPSHHVVGKKLRALATEPQVLQSESSGQNQKINFNQPLTDVLLRMVKKLKLLKSGHHEGHILDIDATPIYTKKFDASLLSQDRKKGLKHGFHPMLATFNSTIPFYVQNRSGNITAKSYVLESLIDCITIAKKHNIPIDTVRIDGAGYSGNIFEYLDKEGLRFLIAARKSSKLYDSDGLHFAKWQKSEKDETEYATFETEHYKTKKPHRVIVKRIPSNGHNRGSAWESRNGYDHYAIVTNDFTSESEYLYRLYTGRANAEALFGKLKGDFNFSKPPFSLLEENTVHMLVCSMAYLVFEKLRNFLAHKMASIKETFQFKKIYRKFISESVIIKRLKNGVQELVTGLEIFAELG